MIQPELILRQLMIEGYEGASLLAAFGRWVRAFDVPAASNMQKVQTADRAPVAGRSATRAKTAQVAPAPMPMVAITVPPENAKAIARKAIAQSMLSPSTIALASHLIEHFNLVTGRCDPGSGSLANSLGISVRQVRRSVKGLVDAGLFGKARHGGRGFANAYLPNWPLLVERAAEGDIAAKRTTLSANAANVVTQNHLNKPDSDSVFVGPQRRRGPQREPDRRQMHLVMPIAGGRDKSEAAVRDKLTKELDAHMRHLFMPHDKPSFVTGLSASMNIGGAWDKAIAAEMMSKGNGLTVLLQAIDAVTSRRATG